MRYYWDSISGGVNDDDDDKLMSFKQPEKSVRIQNIVL